MKNLKYIKIIHFADLSDLVDLPYFDNLNQLRHWHKDVDIMTLTQTYTSVPRLLLRNGADFVVTSNENQMKNAQIIENTLLFCLKQDYLKQDGDIMLVKIIGNGIVCRKIYDKIDHYILECDHDRCRFNKDKIKIIAMVTGKFND